LFFDGTWNQVSDNTDIWRFRALFALKAPMATPSARARVVLNRPRRKLRRSHQRRNVWRRHRYRDHQTHEWLMENYHPGAEAFIFGFSRRAQTARSPSRFASKSGLFAALGGQTDLHALSPLRAAGERTHSNARVSKPASLAALVPAQ
jgi:uncharacterized protein (DUF2235 family)